MPELKTAKHPKATDLLCEWLSTEEHASVQIALINSLASHRNQKTADALSACLVRNDISHRVKGSALIALAKLGKYSSEDENFQHCTHEGWKHYVRVFPDPSAWTS